MSYFRSKSIYFSVSLVILLPMICLIIYSASAHRDRDIEERHMRMNYIAMQAERKIEDSEDASQINAIIRDLSQSVPVFDIGYYSFADDRITVYYGGKSPDRIRSWLLESTSSTPSDQPFVWVTRGDILVARQIELSDHPVGYFFASFSIDDIQGAYSLNILISTVILLMVTLLVLLLIRGLTNRFNHSLEILSDQIQIDEEKCEELVVYPDIQPIIERINRKNSDLRNMAQKYIHEANKMKQLMDMTPLGILSIDERGTITAVNAAYARLHPDIDRSRLLGMNIHVLSEHSSYPDVEKKIELALSGVVTDAEMLEQEQKVMLVYAYPIHDENDEISGALGLCQDITEIEKLRNELHRIDRLHVIGQMAASFAHEVRNPLTVIRGFMQLMQQNIDSGKMHDYLKMVISELDRSNEIIGNFLSLAQNRFLYKEQVNLNKIIEEIEALLYAEANHSNIELYIDKDPRLKDLMLNDKEIKQLILNLSRNGIESMSGSGQLYISTKQLKDAVLLEVRDTGHGIQPDKLKQLFDPFYTTKPNGTGLGLAVCLSIVEQHQAKIDVTSEEGVGTTFTIRFDLLSENVTEHNAEAG